jgi:hypothetical protein
VLGLGASAANAALIQYTATAAQFGATGTFSAVYDTTGFGGLVSLSGTITWNNMPILVSVRAFDRNTDAQMTNFGGPYLPDPGEEFAGSQDASTFWTAADHAVAAAPPEAAAAARRSPSPRLAGPEAAAFRAAQERKAPQGAPFCFAAVRSSLSRRRPCRAARAGARRRSRR